MELPTVSLDELARMVEENDRLFVRWSRGPEVDLERKRSLDDLTETELPGLSANSLAVEDWWEDRPVRLWVARRLYDYLHMRERRGSDVRPWILEGEEVARGPDNEPLVECRRAVAWVADDVVDEAVRLVESSPGEWGPLARTATAPEASAERRR